MFDSGNYILWLAFAVCLFVAALIIVIVIALLKEHKKNKIFKSDFVDDDDEMLSGEDLTNISEYGVGVLTDDDDFESFGQHVSNDNDDVGFDLNSSFNMPQPPPFRKRSDRYSN